MAPELIETAKCSTKVDVYSFGCVVYEVIGEKSCYYDRTFKQNLEVGFSRVCYIVLFESGSRFKTDYPTWNA